MPFYAGARIAEVAALDVEDVKLSARKGSLHRVGKGEKSRDVPVVSIEGQQRAKAAGERATIHELTARDLEQMVHRLAASFNALTDEELAVLLGAFGFRGQDR